MENQSKLSVIRFPNSSVLRIAQSGNRGFFVSSDNVIIIDVPSLSFVIKFLVQNGFMSKKNLRRYTV
jgi:hypothetical protein